MSQNKEAEGAVSEKEPLQPEKLDLCSTDIAGGNRDELLRLFPEIRTEGGKIDFDRLKFALGERVDVGKERYGLTWPGKADCFRAIQAPSIGTLRPYPEESVNFDTTENLIIEGDNLEVLKLLQKSYLGKVKVIYIDPPYNTGNDFIYPDNYSESLQTYLEYTGQVDAQGKKFSTNTDADGRFHSKWLNMMYPRLYLARNLLQGDGLIFVSIDDGEMDNLRRVLDDVFGSENFLCQITVVSNPRGRQSEIVATTHEYLVVYGRGQLEVTLRGQPLAERQLAEYRYETPDGRQYRLRGLRHRGNSSRRVDRPKMFYPLFVDPVSRSVTTVQSASNSIEVLPRKSTGEDGRWEWGPETAAARSHLLEAVSVERRGEWDIQQREFLESALGERRMTKWRSVWDEKEINYQNAGQELKALFGESPLEYPKPTYLLKKILTGSMSTGDTVLDFFAGSGTTAAAVQMLNKMDGGGRRFIIVQLPEPSGRSDYPTIAEITKERVRRVIKALNEEGDGTIDFEERANEDRGFRVFKLAESNFKTWDGASNPDASKLGEQLELHAAHVREGRTPQDILYEILLKSGFPVTTLVEALTISGKTVFAIAGGEMFVCLEQSLTLELIREIATRPVGRVVCLDESFAGNDQLKTNAVQIFKTKGIVFKTV